MDQGMDSRNHAMMAGPTAWLYTVAAGLTMEPESVGFQSAVFAPPQQLIMAAMVADTEAEDTNSSQGLRHAAASKRTLMGTFAIEWSLPKPPRVDAFCYSGVCMASELRDSCGVAEAPKAYLPLHFGCENWPMNNITSVDFAEWGLPEGNCSSGLRSGRCGFDLRADLEKHCVGQPRCTVMCGYTDSPTYGFSPGVDSPHSGCVIVTAATGPAPDYTGAAFVPMPAPHFDPCFGPTYHQNRLAVKVSCGQSRGTILKINVDVPGNAAGVTKVPLLGSAADAVTITEGGADVWRGGAFVPGVEGVASARLGADSGVVEVSHGSGRYRFVRSG